MGREINKDIILKRLNDIPDFVTDYEVDENSISGSCKKAIFTHKLCGTKFEMLVKSFIGNPSNPGHRCPECAKKLRVIHNTKNNENKILNTRKGHSRKSIDYYIEKINENPDYQFISLVENDYKGCENKAKILHKKCGKIFEKRFADFIYNKQFCPYCVPNTRIKDYELVKKKFLEHGFELLDDYFKGTHSKSHLRCIDCKEECERSYNTIVNLNGKCGCHKDESKGEKIIKAILESFNISFIRNKTFEDLKLISNLRCDFYIKDLNTIIEYDGLQHFKENLRFSSSLIDIRKRDIQKNEYAFQNNIQIIRISYKEISLDEIQKILKYFLLNQLIDGKPYDGKLSRTVWVGGKSNYNDYIEYNS